MQSMIRHHRLIIVTMLLWVGSVGFAQLPRPTEIPPSKILTPAENTLLPLPDTDLPFPASPAVQRPNLILPGAEAPIDAAKPTAAEDMFNYFGPVASPQERMWGVMGFRGFYSGQKEAPNGVRYHPLFSLDVDINVAITKDRSFYVFMLTRFWGQSAADGVGNPHQGAFDFSKRQWDLTIGGAWNYYDALELRAFGYSYNNLNRGKWLDQSYGYNDGFGLENRYYFAGTNFDRGIYNYVAAGFYPSKTLVDLEGNEFNPGWYLSASMNVGIWEDFAYGYCVTQLTAQKSGQPKLLYLDAGIAVRPFVVYPALEVRAGAENTYDLEYNIWLPTWYFSLRFGF
jgi:hypothetical protein